MVVVAQLGARMHYAVPAILARSEMLKRLCIDVFAPRLSGPLRGGLEDVSRRLTS